MFIGIARLNKLVKISGLEKKDIKKSIANRHNADIFEVNQDFLYVVSDSLTEGCEFSSSFQDGKVVSVLSGRLMVDVIHEDQCHSMICDSLLKKDFSILEKANGDFCFFMSYNDDEKDEFKIFLCGDKLGIRPIYYYYKDDMLIFSTNMSFLEKLPFVNTKISLQSVSEIIVLGYPLSDKTAYENIKVIKSSELVEFQKGKVSYNTYWRWDKFYNIEGTKDYILDTAHKLFLKSIERRLMGDDSVLAFLSGGMDSRTIISALVELDTVVQSINFSPYDSLDSFCAKSYATNVNIPLFSFERKFIHKGFRTQLASFASNLTKKGLVNATRKNCIWSGDGGSVSVGAVYLNTEIITLMRSNEVGQAVDLFLKENQLSLPKSFMEKGVAEELLSTIKRDIIKEIDKFDCSDPGQAFHLFLMTNDQRRHLWDFYEDCGAHRLEYHLPFFDSDFLSFIFSIPIDYRLNHQFYTEWWSKFNPNISSVPWQTYNGHVSCPLEVSSRLERQWDKKNTDFKMTDLGERLSISFNLINKSFKKHREGYPLINTRTALAGLLNIFNGEYRYLEHAQDVFSYYFRK